MSLNIGYEAIAFQGKSKLARELVNIFQNVIDLRESIPESDTISRIKKVREYVFKVTGFQFIDCVKKHTGLDVRSFIIFDSVCVNFCCATTIGDDINGLKYRDVVLRYSGLEPDFLFKDYIAQKKLKLYTADELLTVANSVNQLTGKLIHNDENKIKCSCDIYFDVYSAFLAKEMINKNFDYMSAEEVAAVMLHEIGHTITGLSNSAEYFFRVELMNRYIQDFSKNANKEEKNKLASTIIKKMLSKNTKEYAEIEKELEIYTDATSSTMKANIDQFIATMYDLFFSTIYGTASLVYDTFASIFSQGSDAFVPSKKEGKASDYGPLTKQLKYCEQLADEFVVRHGLGAQFISCSCKAEKYSSITNPGSTAARYCDSFTLHMSKLPALLYIMLVGDCTGGEHYDHLAQRFKKITSDILKAFRDSDLPIELKKGYIRDYEMAILNSRKNRTLTLTMESASITLHKMLYYIISTPVSMFASGRFRKEYDTLMNNAEKLIANSLYYRAAKLDVLLNKKG